MNFKYFACKTCKSYVSAGYRWAYWTLEQTRLVEANCSFNMSTILNAHKYWNPNLNDADSAGSEWLTEKVLPRVKNFLAEHEGHDLVYVDSGDFFGIDNFDDWTEIET